MQFLEKIIGISLQILKILSFSHCIFMNSVVYIHSQENLSEKFILVIQRLRFANYTYCAQFVLDVTFNIHTQNDVIPAN